MNRINRLREEIRGQIEMFAPGSRPPSAPVSQAQSLHAMQMSRDLPMEKVYFQMSNETLVNPYGSLALYLQALEAACRFRFTHTFTGQTNNQSFPYLNGLQLASPVVGGNNGSVSLSHFIKRFFNPKGVMMKAPFMKLDTAAGNPFVFSVIDHNSAHHLSYLLARRAFTQYSKGNTGQRRYRLVLNFDQHEDFPRGNLGRDMIRCSTWGRSLFADKTVTTEAFPVADAYAVVGLGQGIPSGQLQCKFYDRGRLQDRNGTRINTQGGNRVNQLIEYLTGHLPHSQDWADWDLYITIDRDWTLGSRTPYGDGSHEAAHGRNCLKNTMAQLSGLGAWLSGMDIIGLPSGVGRSNRNQPNDQQDLRNTQDRAVLDIVHGQAFADVKFCYEEAMRFRSFQLAPRPQRA